MPTLRRSFGLAFAVPGLLLVVLLVVLLGGCGRRSSRDPGPLRVVVSIAPLSSLARSVSPPDAEVRVIIPPGRSEHGFEVAPSDIAAISSADLVVVVGLGLDSSVEQAARRAKRRTLVFADEVGIKSGHEHDHDDHGHDHAVDPHLWLDCALVERLAPGLRREVSAALARAGLPEDAAELDRRAADLVALCQAVDGEYRAAIEKLPSRTLVTHHNAWARLASRYGLDVLAVIRPIESVDPTPGQIAQAVDAISKQGARVIFVEPQYSPQAAERVADAAKVRVGRLDPLGTGDWAAMMRSNLAELVRGLSE